MVGSLDAGKLSRSHARIVFRYFDFGRSSILCSTRDLQFFSLDSAVTAIRSASRRDRVGSTGILQLRQLAFSGYGPVFFACAFDAVFDFAPVVEKLLARIIHDGMSWGGERRRNRPAHV